MNLLPIAIQGLKDELMKIVAMQTSNGLSTTVDLVRREIKARAVNHRFCWSMELSTGRIRYYLNALARDGFICRESFGRGTVHYTLGHDALIQFGLQEA